MFLQFPRLKGGDGKEIKAAPTEVVLGFLRPTGVDEKHLARKPACQSPQSKDTEPHHQEGKKLLNVNLASIQVSGFVEQRTASYSCPAKGLQNEVDYISQFLIPPEDRCLILEG